MGKDWAGIVAANKVILRENLKAAVRAEQEAKERAAWGRQLRIQEKERKKEVERRCREYPALYNRVSNLEEELKKEKRYRKAMSFLVNQHIEKFHFSFSNGESSTERSEEFIQFLFSLGHSWALHRSSLFREVEEKKYNQRYWLSDKLLLRVSQTTRFIRRKRRKPHENYGHHIEKWWFVFEDLGGVLYQKEITEKEWKKWRAL